MHLVACKRSTVAGFTVHRLELLVSTQQGFDLEQAEAFGGTDLPFDTCGVADRSSEHLIAAAEADHETAAPPVGGDVDVKSRRAQRGKIGNCRLRPRQDYEVGV